MMRRFGSSPKPASRVRSTISSYVSAVGSQAVAHAVVAREVRRGLGRRDEVVAGEPVLDGARQLALVDLGAELRGEVDRAPHGVGDARLDALGLVHLARHADADAVEPRPRADDDLRDVDRGRVARVAAR